MTIDLVRAKEIVASMCLAREACRLKPYLCPAGVPTIGVGATYYKDMSRVSLLDAPITRDAAIALLDWMIETVYMPAVMLLCPEIDTTERLAAIVDFCFNVGIEKFKTSTLFKRIKTRRWADVPKEVLKWNKARGIVLLGLVSRRQAEVVLICQPAM
jgi:lysozyme